MTLHLYVRRARGEKIAVVMHRSGSGSSIYVSHPLLLVPLDTRAGP